MLCGMRESQQSSPAVVEFRAGVSGCSQMKRKTLLILASGVILRSFIVILLVRVDYAFARFSRVQHQFASVHAGDSRASVLDRMGKPNYYSGACGVIQPSRNQCALEYVYSHPFAPLDPQYYIVTFSSNGRVIEANPWSSP